MFTGSSSIVTGSLHCSTAIFKRTMDFGRDMDPRRDYSFEQMKFYLRRIHAELEIHDLYLDDFPTTNDDRHWRWFYTTLDLEDEDWLFFHRFVYDLRKCVRTGRGGCVLSALYIAGVHGAVMYKNQPKVLNAVNNEGSVAVLKVD
jgi:hypothetical protein